MPDNFHPQIITMQDITNPTYVGYCHCCNQKIISGIPVWLANMDDILCPYYGVSKLIYCSKECLEKETASVLDQLKNAQKAIKDQTQQKD